MVRWNSFQGFNIHQEVFFMSDRDEAALSGARHLQCDSDGVRRPELSTRVDHHRRPESQRPRAVLDMRPEIVETDLGPVNGRALPRL